MSTLLGEQMVREAVNPVRERYLQQISNDGGVIPDFDISLDFAGSDGARLRVQQLIPMERVPDPTQPDMMLDHRSHTVLGTSFILGVRPIFRSNDGKMMVVYDADHQKYFQATHLTFQDPQSLTGAVRKTKNLVKGSEACIDAGAKRKSAKKHSVKRPANA